MAYGLKACSCHPLSLKLHIQVLIFRLRKTSRLEPRLTEQAERRQHEETWLNSQNKQKGCGIT